MNALQYKLNTEDIKSNIVMLKHKKTQLSEKLF